MTTLCASGFVAKSHFLLTGHRRLAVTRRLTAPYCFCLCLAPVPTPTPVEYHSTVSNPILSPSLRHLLVMFFERLPVDLIAEILGELDLESLIKMAYVSKRFYSVASDPSLNPWRRPIMRILHMHMYEPALKHLSVRLTVPRRNWIEIIALARPSFVLYDATLPNLKSEEWEECFKRRFLPSWQKWRKESSWKEAFLKYDLSCEGAS